jgi:hypothetical protein
MKRFLFPLLLTVILFLTACSSATTTSDQTASGSGVAESTPSSAPDQTASGSGVAESTPSSAPDQTVSGSGVTESTPSSGQTLADEQGAITIKVTPLNLNGSAEALVFDVVMDTHSVDLSMDLATLATLTTDNRIIVQAVEWDAPRGGHHVEGKLIFPSTQDGKSILEGATKLTLAILNLDAPSRTFEWELE